MSNDNPPNLTIAAETDPAELEKAEALREIGWETREMVANLLRVTRGAGLTMSTGAPVALLCRTRMRACRWFSPRRAHRLISGLFTSCSRWHIRADVHQARPHDRRPH
jgi:hypothetical protein